MILSFINIWNYMRVHVVMWGLSIYATVALLKRLSINHSSLLWGLWYPSNMTVIAKGFHWDHPRSSSTSSLLMNWPKQHEKQGCREPCCPSYKLLLLLMYRNQWESCDRKLSYITIWSLKNNYCVKNWAFLVNNCLFLSNLKRAHTPWHLNWNNWKKFF